MIDPTRLRTGWRPALLDAVAAMAAVVPTWLADRDLASEPRRSAAALLVFALVVAVQIAVNARMRLYVRRGLVMWPLRLMLGALAGAAVGLILTELPGPGASLSPELFGIQAAWFVLIGALWRFVVGLVIRSAGRDALDQSGADALVVLGADIASMTGGFARSWGYRHLLANLVVKDLKLKYQRSVLGFAWSLLNPLMMIAVYSVAFTYILRIQTPRFVLFVLIGLLAWNFFAGAMTSATEAVVGNATLLRSVVFPRLVLAFSSVSFNLVQYLLTLVVFLPVMLLFYEVPLAPRMLLFPLFLLLHVLFTAGVTLLLATLAAMFRDVKHLVEVSIGLFFWATPIIYEPTMIPAQFQELALLSPVASYIRAYQDIFYYGVTPDLPVWTIATVYALAMFVCGLSVFLAYEDRFPELA